MRLIILSFSLCSFLLSGQAVTSARSACLRDGGRPAEAIKEIEGLKLVAGSFGKDGPFAGNRQVVVLRSWKQAKGFFDKESWPKLEKSIDFKKQKVLLFAWQGSGGDQLGFQVLESFPEQIHFDLVPGRTKDLRQHFRVFALRANVVWKSEFKEKKLKKNR